jgi:hypothetical protein
VASQVPAPAGEPLHDAPDAVAPAPALLRAALDASTEAVVLCRASEDRILLVDAAAAGLVPGLGAGGTTTEAALGGLARAAAAGADDFTDEYAGRRVRGHRRRLDDHHYGWYLRDCTEDHERPAAIEAERARTAFLAEAGRRRRSRSTSAGPSGGRGSGHPRYKTRRSWSCGCPYASYRRVCSYHNSKIGEGLMGRSSSKSSPWHPSPDPGKHACPAIHRRRPRVRLPARLGRTAAPCGQAESVRDHGVVAVRTGSVLH